MQVDASGDGGGCAAEARWGDQIVAMSTSRAQIVQRNGAYWRSSYPGHCSLRHSIPTLARHCEGERTQIVSDLTCIPRLPSLLSLSAYLTSILPTLVARMPEPPYLYSAPARRQIAYPYSDFDPKAVTRASWDRATQASKPRPKQEGPLIDFNKHPDSYMIVEGSKVEHKPLPANTKKSIKIVRWVQFAIRVLQLIGAVGSLVCIICIQNAPAAQAWIMRIPVSCS